MANKIETKEGEKLSTEDVGPSVKSQTLQPRDQDLTEKSMRRENSERSVITNGNNNEDENDYLQIFSRQTNMQSSIIGQETDTSLESSLFYLNDEPSQQVYNCI